MILKKIQYIVLFSLLVSFSAPVHAFWGQETLSSWANSITSYVADVKEHPADHKVAIAVGTVCTLGLAAVAWKAWSWWNTPTQPLHFDAGLSSASEGDDTENSDVSDSDPQGDEVPAVEQQTIFQESDTHSHINTDSHLSLPDPVVAPSPINNIGLLGGLLTGIAGAAASQNPVPSSSQSTEQSRLSSSSQQADSAQEQATAQAEQLRLQQEQAARAHIDASMQQQVIQDNPNVESTAAYAQRIAQKQKAAQEAQLRLQQDIAAREAAAQLQPAASNPVQAIEQSGPSSSSDPVNSESALLIDHNPSAPATSADVQNQRQVQGHPDKRRMTAKTRALIKAKKQSKAEEKARRLALQLQEQEDRENVQKAAMAQKEAAEKAAYDTALANHQAEQLRLQQEQECDRVIEYYHAIYGEDPTPEILAGLLQHDWRHILDTECRRVTAQAYQTINNSTPSFAALEQILKEPGAWVSLVEQARVKQKANDDTAQEIARALQSPRPGSSSPTHGGQQELMPKVKDLVNDLGDDRSMWRDLTDQELQGLNSDELMDFLQYIIRSNPDEMSDNQDAVKEFNELSQSMELRDIVKRCYDQARSAALSVELASFAPVTHEQQEIFTDFLNKLEREKCVSEHSIKLIGTDNLLGLFKKRGIKGVLTGLIQTQQSETELGVMGRHFMPVSQRPTSVKLVLSIHGTFANPDSFGGKEEHETTQALYAALQRLADKENARIDLVVPHWSSEFNGDHRLLGAHFIGSFIKQWYEKNKAAGEGKCFIDMAAHSEGNSIVAAVLSGLQDQPEVKKLITWMSICPTAGSDCSHEGIRARLSFWSPSDALALLASSTRGRTFRKPDNDIAQEQATVMNFCTRHNGMYVDHVTAKPPVYAHYDRLFEIAEQYKGFCELSIDFADANKEILVGVRPVYRDYCRPDLSASKRAELLALNELHEKRFAQLYPDQQWHEKPHSAWNFVWKYIGHGLSEVGSAKANDRRKAEAALLPPKTAQDIEQMYNAAQEKYGDSRLYGTQPSLRELCARSLARQSMADSSGMHIPRSASHGAMPSSSTMQPQVPQSSSSHTPLLLTRRNSN